ncbi:MAG TPA: potassium-transporting ATPase subunit KdpA [Thermoleophilaceae bacterium]|nr:potassium-transporting ATPase subunit KdpA [Thermoleophilaceae bacterium]
MAALVVVLTAVAPLLGSYMARVYQGERVAFARVLAPVERLGYRICRVDPDASQDWKEYARSVLIFSALGVVVLYALLRTQNIHPFNPQSFHSGPWDLSFNTATSFVSNTSWQFYAGETTLSYFSQMAGIVVASFTSMATGMAVAAAVIRGFGRRGGAGLGNFWVDLIRSLLYVISPVTIVAALFLAASGVPQTLDPSVAAHGLTGLKQTIAVGPVASQEAIKLLSGDGGGFFNVNSAHPFENPTALTNFVEMLLMLLVPAAFTITFGAMVGSRRTGWALYTVMLVMFVGGAVAMTLAETHGTPALHAVGVHGAAMEGKEQRFGAAGGALFVQSGTASGDGAVNSAIESFSGTGSAVAMANIMTGEVIFGGPGVGLYGMLLLLVLAVFVAGLMVGRTPEFLGKQIRAREVKLATLGILVAPFLVLALTAVALVTPVGLQSVFAHGPQGMSESLYAYLSQTNNNGSAFAGYAGFIQPAPGNIGAHGVTFADLAGGLAMLLGRFVPIVLALALAGSLSTRRVTPPGLGTLRIETPTFVLYLVGFVVLVAVLTFLSALVLAPGPQALGSRLYG